MLLKDNQTETSYLIQDFLFTNHQLSFSTSFQHGIFFILHLMHFDKFNFKMDQASLRCQVYTFHNVQNRSYLYCNGDALE